MYRLSNLTLDTTTTYKNKDLVYQALERENAKVKHQEAEGLLLVEELDKKGVVISQEEILLPFEGVPESLFLQHGHTSKLAEKQQHSSKRSETVNDQESISTEKQERRKSLSDTPSFLKRLCQWGMGLLMLASLALAGLSTLLVITQSKQVVSLTRQVKQIEKLQSETGKLDAFGRYFLSHYYSEQGELSNFVSSKLALNHPSGQLQSVILETASQAGAKTYQLTYVLTIKDGENRTQKRLTLTIEEVASALYGYQVITEPRQTTYPK